MAPSEERGAHLDLCQRNNSARSFMQFSVSFVDIVLLNLTPCT
jgi:hypothetical protein